MGDQVRTFGLYAPHATLVARARQSLAIALGAESKSFAAPFTSGLLWHLALTATVDLSSYSSTKFHKRTPYLTGRARNTRR